MNNELSQEVITALKIVWNDYFPEDMTYQECISRFIEDLKYHAVGASLCDIFRQKLIDNEVLTTDKQKAYAILFLEENKYPI